MNTSNRKLAWVYVGLIVLGFCLSKFGHARIDPEDVIGLWLFDEQSGKTIKDSSGNGNDGEALGKFKRAPGKALMAKIILKSQIRRMRKTNWQRRMLFQCG